VRLAQSKQGSVVAAYGFKTPNGSRVPKHSLRLTGLLNFFSCESAVKEDVVDTAFATIADCSFVDLEVLFDVFVFPL
jgi:hypothetical protein